MNINIDDPILKNNQEFQEFLKNNPGRGFLKIRATAASEALPVSGVEVIVTKKIGDDTIKFFSGQTDNSGMINGIVLPTPSKNTNDLVAPEFAEYDLHVLYPKENIDKHYSVSLCCSISVIQYINIIPDVVERND